MLKYEPLYEFLKNKNEETICLTYEEIEKIINDVLPLSAYKYNEFWNNGSKHSCVKPILEAGYKVDYIDKDNGKLYLVKNK